ncbi:MAG: CHAD domain-containing protein [Steroidobacteraceae bacterium]
MISAASIPKPANECAGIDRREVEWQLTASDLDLVRRWLVAHPAVDGWHIETRPTLELQDTYFDTSDWRVFRSGFALRVRDAAGTAEATLKELHSASSTQADRRELTEPLGGTERESLLGLVGPVGARVHAVAGTQPLLPLFGVRTSRQRFALRFEDSAEAQGEVALDETIISRPDGAAQTSLQRVEVEALTAESSDLEAFVDLIRRECALIPATDSKYAVGLNCVGLAPPTAPQFESVCANGTMRVDEVALISLRRYVSDWIAYEPAARLGESPDALHDLRVAGRRIDATLALFAPFLPTSWLRMRARLKWLMRTFGPVRDLDIQLGVLEQFEKELPETDRDAVTPLKFHLETEHSKARARMLRALDAPTTSRWFERLKRMCAQSSASRGNRTQPLAVGVVPALVRGRYRKFRKAAKRLTAASSAEDYHEVRVKVKKLRYAIETVAGVYGKPAERFLRSLRQLQNSLGEQQDAHVAQMSLQVLARQSRKRFPRETMFLMGRFAERQSVSGRHARDDFEKDNRQLHRKRWKRLGRKLDALSGQSNERQGDGGSSDAANPPVAAPASSST